MKICFLTQTASDVSDYYKKFFLGKDLFFVTFKNPNDKAVDYVPKSTWSEGRNKLWESVKDKYDYYVFIDDDLQFRRFNRSLTSFPYLSYLYYKLRVKNFNACFVKAEPEYFFDTLEHYLESFKPEVLSVTQLDGNPVNDLDVYALQRNSFVRRTGFFDAQFTVLSNYAANKLLPYDVKLSGWSSSQIPVYLYAFHVFGTKAINVSELGVANSFHVGVYAENYNGMQDCKRMIAKISETTNRDYSSLGGQNSNDAVSYLYGSTLIQSSIPSKNSIEDYKSNFNKNLSGIENLLHKNVLI